jgi:hypothetical protein
MFNFRQKLLAVVVGCFLAAGVSAQRRDGDKRPPKDKNVVVVKEKDQKRPRNNDNRGNNKPKDDRRGKP